VQLSRVHRQRNILFALRSPLCDGLPKITYSLSRHACRNFDLFLTKIDSIRQAPVYKIALGTRSSKEKVKKDQSTIYCGINISLPHFVVFFLYKGKIFC
jgi:hypothetical protein